MGIYVFNREILRKVLDNDKTDFGKHIIPDAIGRHRVSGLHLSGILGGRGNHSARF